MKIINSESINRLLARKKALKNSEYTQYDEVYSLWELGYRLGEVYLNAHLPRDNQTELSGATTLAESSTGFIMNYENIRTHSQVLNKQNRIIQPVIEKLQTPGGNDSLVIMVEDLKKKLEADIKSFSTHLANIFKFGYQLNVLRGSFLRHDRTKEDIQNQLQKIKYYIKAIDLGDKQLESQNLEISSFNLKIVETTFLLLSKRIDALLKNAHKQYEEYVVLINEKVFGVLTDILLDIRNPVQFIRNKFMLFIIYYYSLVIILTAAELSIDALSDQPINMQEKVTGWLQNFSFLGEQNDVLNWLIYILPWLVYLIGFLYKRYNNSIVRMLIRRKLSAQIKVFLKAAEKDTTYRTT